MPAQRYVIPFPKLAGYLLNLGHKRGSSKAQFFINRGFDPHLPQIVANALFQHAIDHWPGLVTPQPYGRSYEVAGLMRCPNGASARVIAIWKIELGSDEAALVTAYPY